MTKKETKKQMQEEKFLMLPSVDFCFKELMEEKEMELLPKQLRKKYKEEKYGILDVHIRLNNGERMNIEMQSTAYDYWRERSLFYLSKMYTDKSEIHILELTKHYEYPQTELLRWAKFFGAKNREEIQMLTEQDKYIDKAYRRLEEMSADEQKRWEYEMRQKAIRDHRHMLASGRREGEQIGEQRGEHNKAVELAQKMLARGRDTVEEIAELTGLPLEEIQKLL